jgi:hypothetical protein
MIAEAAEPGVSTVASQLPGLSGVYCHVQNGKVVEGSTKASLMVTVVAEEAAQQLITSMAYAVPHETDGVVSSKIFGASRDVAQQLADQVCKKTRRPVFVQTGPVAVDDGMLYRHVVQFVDSVV